MLFGKNHEALIRSNINKSTGVTAELIKETIVLELVEIAELNSELLNPLAKNKTNIINELYDCLFYHRSIYYLLNEMHSIEVPTYIKNSFIFKLEDFNNPVHYNYCLNIEKNNEYLFNKKIKKVIPDIELLLFDMSSSLQFLYNFYVPRRHRNETGFNQDVSKISKFLIDALKIQSATIELSQKLHTKEIFPVFSMLTDRENVLFPKLTNILKASNNA
jgi:hypothetical protein